MPERQTAEPSAFSQYLATNHPIGPDYVVHDTNGEVIAAKWHRPASRNATQIATAQHTLMYHAGGSTSVAKYVNGRCVGTRAQHGTVTFSPRDELSEWLRGGVCEVMHVYVRPALIRRYAEENLGGDTTPDVDPLFAVADPWLQAFFGLLLSELEIFGGDRKQPDPLLLTQSMELLIRHLVRWHSNAPQRNRERAAGRAATQPIAPRHLARIIAYIDANIGEEMALDDLARLVGLSKYHFIRSFRAATQRTPYAYVVERRLARAVEALRHSIMPIEQIAEVAGFKSTPGFSNVFKKHYGVSPSRFRAQSR